jgi:hypothetical protein
MRRVGPATDARRDVPQRVTLGPARQKRAVRRGEVCRRWLWAGVEAARRAEMAVRMDLDPVSQTPGQRSREAAASGPRGHPVTPKRRPCSPRPGIRGQGPGSAPGHSAISTADWLRAFSRPARVTGYARWPGTAAPAGHACAGLGLLSRSASACRCAGASAGAASASSLIQASKPLPEWRAGCPFWS